MSEDAITVPADVLSPYDDVFAAIAEYLREVEGLDDGEYVTAAEFAVDAEEDTVDVTAYTTTERVDAPEDADA